MKLYYTHNLQPRVAVAVARYLNAPVELVRAEPMGADQEMFRPLNPNTLAPVLVEAGGSLWETDAIACRLAALTDRSFFPLDQIEEMLRWLSWNAYHFTRAGSTFYFEHITRPTYMTRPADECALAEADGEFRRCAAILDAVLADRQWLIDGRPTYADFRVATALPFAERARLPLDGYDNIRRWHDRLNQFDAWREPFAGIA